MFGHYIGQIVITIVILNTFVECNRFERIVDGIESNIQKRPYQVSLQSIYRNLHICGGSLIAENIIVTAAHCVVREDASNLQVRLGSSVCHEGGILIKVKAFKYHEKYNTEEKKYDVAVLQLEESVKESSTIQYIDLATSLPETGATAIVSGWGRTCTVFCTTSKILREVEVAFVNLSECASEEYSYGNRVTDTMVCAYSENKDSCDGDSGGPLVVNGKLVGIVSWGENCALKNYPGVYSDVVALRDWILNTSNILRNNSGIFHETFSK